MVILFYSHFLFLHISFYGSFHILSFFFFVTFCFVHYISNISSFKYIVRNPMADAKLPSRIYPDNFRRGNHKITVYPKLWWIALIVKTVPPPQQRLQDSSLGRLLQLPSMFTFSRTFTSYLAGCSRQIFIIICLGGFH